MLAIFPVRSVRKQKTRRYLSWFHNNELPKYVRTTPGISLIIYSRAHSKFGPMEQKTLDILERIFIIKAGWLHNTVWNQFQDFNVIFLALKVLLLQMPLHLCFWCYCKCFLGSNLIENNLFSSSKEDKSVVPHISVLLRVEHHELMCQGVYGSWSW